MNRITNVEDIWSSPNSTKPLVVGSTVYLIDCIAGMKEYPDNYFDLAVVDPPYGIGDTFISFSTGVKKGKLERKHKEMKWDDAIPEMRYFTELYRVSKKQVVWGANYFNCFTSGGALVWYKNRGGDTLSQCEIASVSWQKKVDYVPLQILTGFCSNETRIHPTQKPIALYDWIFKNYAEPGQRILDTHLGSGNSRISADKYGLDFTGFEIDEEYYQKSEKNFAIHKTQLRIEGW